MPKVNCYAGQLNQMWMNLLVNAAQSIEGEGEVRVMTRLDGPAVRVSAADTGRDFVGGTRVTSSTPFFTTKPVGNGRGSFMGEQPMLILWKWKANFWYPLMRDVICARFGHRWKPSGVFLPCCRLCKAINCQPKFFAARRDEEDAAPLGGAGA